MKANLFKTILVLFLFWAPARMFAFTATTSGNWSSAATWGGVGPGANVSNNDIIIPSGITVTLDVDVTFSGVLNSFTVNGSIVGMSADHSILISQGTFAGTGTMNIHRMSFNGTVLTSSTFSGNLQVDVLQNLGASLTWVSVATITDTLDLDGGSFSIGAGGNVTMVTNSNIRVNNGTVSVSGGIFNTTNSYNVWYVGTSKNAGIELNSLTLNDVHINMNDNAQTITLNANIMVNGDLTFVAGQMILSGYQFTLNGDLTMAPSSRFVSTAASNFTLQGSGSVTSGLRFAGGSAVNTLRIDRTDTATIRLFNDIIISGNLELMHGHLLIESGATLTVSANTLVRIDRGGLISNGGAFSGALTYNIRYEGANTGTGIELTGSGLNDVTIDLDSATNVLQISNDLIMNGAFSLQHGRFDMYSNDVTINSGSFEQWQGTGIIGDSTNDMTLHLTGIIADTMYFVPGHQFVRNFTLDAGTGTTFALGSWLMIYNTLDLASGRLRLLANDLTIKDGGNITGYDNNDYIVTSATSGSLRMYLHNNSSSLTTFPVGTSSYSPGSLQEMASGNSGYFMMRAINGVYQNGTSGYNMATTAPVVNRTWLVRADDSSNVDLNMELGWQATDEVNGFNRAVSYISHYTNGSWDSYNYSAASSGNFGTFISSRTGILSLSPFAVLDTAIALGTNELTAGEIGVYPNPSNDFVNVTMPSTMHDTYVYELFDMSGKSLFRTENNNQMNRFDLAKFDRGCYMMKITSLTTNQVITRQITRF